MTLVTMLYCDRYRHRGRDYVFDGATLEDFEARAADYLAEHAFRRVTAICEGGREFEVRKLRVVKSA